MLLRRIFGSDAGLRSVSRTQLKVACAPQHSRLLPLAIRFRTRTVAAVSLLLGVLSTPALAGDSTVNTTVGDNVAKSTCDASPVLTFNATGIPRVRPLNGQNCDIGEFESSSDLDIVIRDGFQSP